MYIDEDKEFIEFNGISRPYIVNKFEGGVLRADALKDRFEVRTTIHQCEEIDRSKYIKGECYGKQ